MPFPACCPTCSLTLVAAHRALEPGLVQTVAFCPKCGYEECGPPQTVLDMECDPIFHLLVELPARLTIDQMKVLRAVDPGLGEQPAAEALARLRGLREWTVGPFHRKHEMERVRHRLEDAKLVVICR